MCEFGITLYLCLICILVVTGLCVEVVMGGLPIQDDINKFKSNNIHIVVGSPGRLKHLILEKHINVKSVRLFVLDEADKLMEKSFLADIKFINSTLPKQKQVIMSSATYPESSKEFINQFVHDAQHICPNSNCILLGVTQKITHVKYNSNIVKQTENRFKELLQILTKIPFKQCLIFCNYQARVGELHKMLTKEKWPVQQLYGQQEQIDRLDALKTLQQYKCRILVSTDLAARGIDASNVDLVINFEPPYDWPTYLHRIGRAGRFGSFGLAVTILSEGIEKNKFITLLQSINASVCLTSLWSEDNSEDNFTDEKSKNYIPTSNSLTNHCSENKLEKLWKIISDDPEPKKSNESITTFDDLLNSYKETKKDIESFSDLVTSYKMSQVSDHTDSNVDFYKNITMPNKSDIIYLNENLNFIKTNIGKKEDNSRESIHDNDNNSLTHDATLLSPNLEDTHHEKCAKYHIKCDINDNKINTDFDNENELKYKLENKVEDSLNLEDKNVGLLKLGLPTCFSSTHNRQKNNARVTQQNKNTNTKVTKYSEQNSSDSPNNLLIKNINKDTISNYNLIKRNHAKSKKTKENQILKQNTSNFQYNSYATVSSLSQNCVVNRKYDYANWYTKLKLQVKQIEHFVYIEELNKLYK